MSMVLQNCGYHSAISVLYPLSRDPLSPQTYQQPRAAHALSPYFPYFHLPPILSLLGGGTERVQTRVSQQVAPFSTLCLSFPINWQQNQRLSESLVVS